MNSLEDAIPLKILEQDQFILEFNHLPFDSKL